MKRAIAFLLMAGLTSFLAAQSLPELAKTEKARRAGFGGRMVPVVTNIDLLRVKIRPAVEIVTPPAEEITPGEETTGETATGSQTEAAVTPPEGVAGVAAETAAPGTQPAAETPDPLPGLKEKLSTTEEQIDLLKTKIAALNQDYTSQTNMVPNYVIEQQLTDTLQKLQAAQAEAIRIQREIDRVTLEKKAARNPVR